MQNAIKAIAKTGDIAPTVELVKEFLKYVSVRDTETFDEMNLKHTFAMLLSLTKQYMVYGEFPANHGFVDVFVQKTSSSLGKYEVVIELKYIAKQNAKENRVNKLIEDAKNQLAKYMEDKRLNQKEYLRKYAIIFIGFEEYIIEEL